MPSGWSAGFFFTRTNVSAEQFGEGSFDKGFYFKIPLNAAVPFENRYIFSETIKPIQGDGGAKVSINGRIHDMVSNQRKTGISNSWAKIWR